mmetsp:Transcript_134385/g.233579  ORF Transcript_134385/g.233579 Transcript_134385/m.233579 type:complete len:82 (+) Transcript_134385:491-736(+)
MRSLSLSSALVASSRRSNGGSRTNARQIATRCFCPPDRRPPLGPTSVSHPLQVGPSMKVHADIFLYSSNFSIETSTPSRLP